jgi:hypothetical protein
MVDNLPLDKRLHHPIGELFRPLADGQEMKLRALSALRKEHRRR